MTTDVRIIMRLARLHDFVTQVSFVLSASCIALIACAYAGEIVARYAFSSPTRWTQDLGAYLLAASTFLAAPQAARERAHVSIDLLSGRLKKGRVARFHNAVMRSLASIACFATAGVAMSVALGASAQNVYTQAALTIPKSWLYFLLAYGLGSCGIYYLRSSADLDEKGR